jgi:uncharacterized protein YjbJ (UPF0337 family)
MTNANPGTAVAVNICRKRRMTMASGKSRKAKGRVKEAVGALTGDKKLKRKGLVDQAVGNIKQMVEGAIELVENFGSSPKRVGRKRGAS